MSLVSIQLDAVEDRALDPVEEFCLALTSGSRLLRDLITRDFSWLGHSVGWDGERIRRLTSWMREGRAVADNLRILSSSIMDTLPEWCVERAFGELDQGDRIALFDLRRGEDLATIAAVLCTRGPLSGRVRRAVDPAEFVRMVRLAQVLQR